jgi:hypothetical protein
MYFELFIGLGTIIGSSYIIKKNYKSKYEYEDYEEIEDDDKSCPLIYFDKNGNYYYVYE